MASGPSWKCVYWSFSILILILLSLHLFIPDRYDLFLPFRKASNDDAPWFKRRIAKELNEIHLEMKTLLINKQIPSARLVQRLGGIVKRLDNSLQPSTTSAETVSKTVVWMCVQMSTKGQRLVTHTMPRDGQSPTVPMPNRFVL
ncbi:hypothetical protein OS493_019648 [Desmophyllum pertusum]|uniref:Uncharacterized protein n=1 Tax=Desmophyllum pertusum TaxID=174260 RepID=A0A9W9ZCJ1_9CNID|nr:hypothetical protein OS493_019648 [Desmophyllum pertusum]